MKLVVESDCHLNKSSFKGVLDKKYNTLPFRTVDFMKAHKYIVDRVVNEIKPDLFVLAGDTYETYDPSNQIRSFANNSFKKMLDAGIEVVLLVGNHDVCKKHHSLSPLKSMNIDKLSIIEEPEVKIYKDKVDRYSYILDLLKSDRLTPEFFNLLDSIYKWDVAKDLKNIKWYCNRCSQRQETPKRTLDIVFCAKCNNELTRRTGGGMSDPFNWTFKSFNRKVKINKILNKIR